MQTDRADRLRALRQDLDTRLREQLPRHESLLIGFAAAMFADAWTRAA